MKLIITTTKKQRIRDNMLASDAINMAAMAISEVVKDYSQHWQDEHLKTAKDRKVVADFVEHLTEIVESAKVESA